jgi:hypothetical protein
MSEHAESANPLAWRYVIAWALALVFYFLELGGSLFAGRNDSAVIGCIRNDSRRGKRNHWHLFTPTLLLTLSPG